ncbi:hypothetical protein [Thermosynechococcus sp. Uc]|uniref:hypothetical protein n=1 Tax=Thermosynechococcus sp. Uc TaxID=3034853 RepID=UPI00345C2986
MIPQDFLDQINPDRYIVPVGEKFHGKDYDPADTAGLKSKVEAQELLYAQNIYALLIIFQAMDAAGKDSTIKHVMNGLNPQGGQVYSFKAPSAEEIEQSMLRSFATPVLNGHRGTLFPPIASGLRGS